MINQTPIIDIKPYIEQYDNPFYSISTRLDSNQKIKMTESSDKENQNDEENYKSKDDARDYDDSSSAKIIDHQELNEIQVEFTPRSLEQLNRFHSKSFHTNRDCNEEKRDECPYCFRLFRSNDESKRAIIDLMTADPRSVYRRKKCLDRLYYFTVDTIHITAWFDCENNLAEIVKIKPWIKSEA